MAGIYPKPHGLNPSSCLNSSQILATHSDLASTSNIISYFNTSDNLEKKMHSKYFLKGWTRRALTIFAAGSTNQSMHSLSL